MCCCQIWDGNHEKIIGVLEAKSEWAMSSLRFVFLRRGSRHGDSGLETGMERSRKFTYPVGVVVTTIETIALGVAGLNALVVTVVKFGTVKLGAIIDRSTEKLLI